jgi:hypothetical protein
MLIFLFLSIFALLDGIYDSNDVTQVFKFVLYMISMFPFINVFILSMNIKSFKLFFKFLNFNIWESLLSSTFAIDYESKNYDKFYRFNIMSKYFCTENGKLKILDRKTLNGIIKNKKVLKSKNTYKTRIKKLGQDIDDLNNFQNYIYEMYFKDEHIVIEYNDVINLIVIRDRNHESYSLPYCHNDLQRITELYLFYKANNYELYYLNQEDSVLQKIFKYKENKWNVLHRMDLNDIINLSFEEISLVINDSCFGTNYFIKIFSHSIYSIISILIIMVPLFYCFVVNYKNEINVDNKTWVITAPTIVFGSLILIMTFSQYSSEQFYIGFIQIENKDKYKFINTMSLVKSFMSFYNVELDSKFNQKNRDMK